MDIKEARKIMRTLRQAGSQRQAAEAMNLPFSTFRDRLRAAKALLGEDEAVGSNRSEAAKSLHAARGDARIKGLEALAEDLSAGGTGVTREAILASRLKSMENLLNIYKKQSLDSQVIREHIFEIAHSKPNVPEWLSIPEATGRKKPGVAALVSQPGVPILFGSDWHWGEVVKPSEIGGVNEYNLVIARQRLHDLVEGTVTLLTKHMVNPQYPGIVFALGGDMVSGNIHEELSETNDMPIMPVVLDLVDHLIAAILRLKQVFGRVFLPCVAGNHGRLHKKVRAKESNFNSYDWLIYQSLDRYFANDPDVTFYIPDGPDALVSVYGHRYLFTHGNQFRGGDGMIGPLGPIMRGDHKKRSRNAQIDQGYDTMVIGHFHQLLQMQKLIVNGSLIGYNEYAFANNFGYEPPQQALWVTHPVHGITFSMPVHLGENAKKPKSDQSPWVSWHDAKIAAGA